MIRQDLRKIILHLFSDWVIFIIIIQAAGCILPKARR